MNTYLSAKNCIRKLRQVRKVMGSDIIVCLVIGQRNIELGWLRPADEPDDEEFSNDEPNPLSLTATDNIITNKPKKNNRMDYVG